MPFPAEIQAALATYDKQKGFWRHRFPNWGFWQRLFGHQAAIRALRELPDTDQLNFLKITQCFIEHLPKTTQASHQVYRVVLNYLSNLDIDTDHATEILITLNKAKLKQINLDLLVIFRGENLKVLRDLLQILHAHNLLLQECFDQIADYHETPDILFIFLSAIKLLKNSNRLNTEIWPTINQLMRELHQVQRLDDENLNKFINLPGNVLRLLTLILSKLREHDLLTQENFALLAQHFQTPEILGVIESGMNTLSENNYLIQKNFNSILKNPEEAGNIAEALIVLEQTNLLTGHNRDQVLQSDNKFLCSNAAYLLYWRQIQAHLMTLPLLDRQTILDQLIDIAKQPQAEEEMQEYINSLLAQKPQSPQIQRQYSSSQLFSAPRNDSDDSEQELDLNKEAAKQLSVF